MIIIKRKKQELSASDMQLLMRMGVCRVALSLQINPAIFAKKKIIFAINY